MSFLMNMIGLRSPPAEDSEAAKGEEEFSEEPKPLTQDFDALPLPPRIPPRASQELRRDQSISRVFNELPQDLPDLNTIQMDVLEYLCHLILNETDHSRMIVHRSRLVRLLKEHEELPKFGRFYSRFLITCCAADLLTTPIEDGASQDDQTGTTVQSGLIGWNEKHWKEMQTGFMKIRDLLLRKDADVLVPTRFKEWNEDEIIEATANESLDRELAKHEMFAEQLPQILQSLQIQEALVVLRDNVFKNRKRAVKQYEEALSEIFVDSETPEALSTIAEEPNRKAVVDQINAFATDLLNEYSLFQLQRRARTLLTKWSESILTTPALVRAGYGGVMAPIEETTGEEDDISALSDKGGDDNLLTQPPAEIASFARRSAPRRSILRRPGRVPSKDLRRVARQNIDAEERLKHADDDDDHPAFGDDENSEQEKENSPDPDEEKTLAQLREELAESNATPSAKRSREDAGLPEWADSDIEEYDSGYYKSKRIRLGKAQQLFTPKRGNRSNPSTPISGRRNHPFSEEEARCIRDGYRKYGPKWADIRDSYDALSSRSGQSIRDKYRTMQKNGEA